MQQSIKRILKQAGKAILALFVVLIAFSFYYECAYDTVEFDKVEVDEPVPNFTWDMRSLDEYVRAQYSTECEGKELIGIDADYVICNGVPEQGMVWMYYHPAISKFLIFRQVSRINFRFDPIAQKLNLIRRSYGNAKALCLSGAPIGEELLAFSMDDYFRETAKRQDIGPGHRLLVYCKYTGEGLAIKLYDDSESHTLIDTEYITKP